VRAYLLDRPSYVVYRGQKIMVPHDYDLNFEIDRMGEILKDLIRIRRGFTYVPTIPTNIDKLLEILRQNRE
jgi:hypothetical protein